MSESIDEKKVFPVAILDRDELYVVGVKQVVQLKNWAVDCPMLWLTDFTPRMGEIKTSGYGEAYGVGLLTSLDDKTFNYWATLPVKADAEVPQGMEKVHIPAGTYLECQIDSLENLPQAFVYAYETWLPEQKEYEPILNSPCYERYPANYQSTGNFAIYFPVKKIA